MIIELKIPGAGESITAPESGKLKILVNAGQKVHVGDIACTIDTSADVKKSGGKNTPDNSVHPIVSPPSSGNPANEATLLQEAVSSHVKVTPLAQNMMNQHNLSVEAIISGLKKITRNEVELVMKNQSPLRPAMQTEVIAGRESERTPMSPLRRKLSKRLVAVKNETAMLTTFNEVDMSVVMSLRKKYQTQFQEKHGRKLGLVSFFTKACTEALLFFPGVNSKIEGDDIISPHFIDIAIAVQTEKGLMVPVIKNAHTMSLAQLELTIADLAQKARTTKLTIEEMTGGTFTITNGGVFGSMLSTPILNPPQSAILGLHKIVERPVVINGRVEIRPIMYVALSYDHRLIDGSDSVSFLVKVKELIEAPQKMVLEGADPEKILLGL
jgi:2-oxoglutarate dehydrogenase E2 component (dihydrolipoamide succinyltransferase)